MNISTEEEARLAIALWQAEPAEAQLRNLKLVVESLELSQMYYEQKGNDKGAARTTACLTILNNRIRELAAG
jgi:hypothetical protein